MQGLNRSLYRSYLLIVGDLRKVRSDSAEVMGVIHKSKWRSERIFHARAYLAVTSFMMYNQAMKFSLAFIMFSLLSFWSHNVMAEDQTPAQGHTNECTLKNKIFCGEWETNQVYHLNITGNHIAYHDAKPDKYNCDIIDEFSDKLHPYSILKCTYYDADWSKKYITEFHMFYFSDYDVKRNLESPDLQIISYTIKDRLQDLFMGYCDSAATQGGEKCESKDLYPNIDNDNYRLSRNIKN